MKSTKYIFLFALLSMLAACGTHPPTTLQSAPDADGTLVIRENGVLRLATGSSGQGTMALNGWQYEFEISNMILDGVGPGRIQLEGNVYNISSASELAGTFQLTSQDTMSGEQGFWFENENGVRVHLKAEGQEVTVRSGGGGSVVTLK